MIASKWMMRSMAALFGLTLASPSALAASEVVLPDAVSKTFKAEFPRARISQVESEVENGVTVYDFEFTDGATEKETDIAADGTMLEFTVVIGTKDLSAAARKTILKQARGGKLRRIERVEIGYEIKAGSISKLPQPVLHYEVEIAKGTQKAEIVVTPDGAVVEPAEWGKDEGKGNTDADDEDKDEKD